MTITASIDASALRRHQDKIKALSDLTRRELRKAIRTGLSGIARDAKGRASWSTRIPGAITVGARLSGSPGGYVKVAGAKAPHGRPYEGVTGSTFRHPVFGGPAWVTQSARPFLFPAAQAGLPAARDAIAAGVDRALKTV